jgi:hypothetical protein
MRGSYAPVTWLAKRGANVLGIVVKVIEFSVVEDVERIDAEFSVIRSQKSGVVFVTDKLKLACQRLSSTI